ncbi:hypothetical protein GSY71_17685 [Pusillimonas sp. TS35]|nr:hypothetical protein [Pusillimonas sp. TS35]
MDGSNPPYPSDVNAKGWRLEIDYLAWERSDGWTLLSESERPFLIMILWQSWRQVPCGSLPESDLLLCKLAGVDSGQWQDLKPRILSGWFLATNRRYYHPLLIERVEDMLRAREGASNRQARFRARDVAARPRGPTKRHQEIEQWLASLPPERARLLNYEFLGARSAGHSIVAPLAWLQEVNARWNEVGRPVLRYGESERARRLADVPPPEPAPEELAPREEVHSICVDLLAQLGKRRK